MTYWHRGLRDGRTYDRQATDAEPFKAGYCDGVFNRECNSPWKDFVNQMKYVKGYMAGKESMKNG